MVWQLDAMQFSLENVTWKKGHLSCNIHVSNLPQSVYSNCFTANANRQSQKRHTLKFSDSWWNRRNNHAESTARLYNVSIHQRSAANAAQQLLLERGFVVCIPELLYSWRILFIRCWKIKIRVNISSIFVSLCNTMWLLGEQQKMTHPIGIYFSTSPGALNSYTCQLSVVTLVYTAIAIWGKKSIHTNFQKYKSITDTFLLFKVLK